MKNRIALWVAKQLAPVLTSVYDRSSAWSRVWPIIREPFTGAWQRNISHRPEDLLSFHAVYSCITLIAGDVGKLRIRLVEQNDEGIWEEVSRNSPFWPVLRKPNNYLNRIKFFEQWIVSKLVNGNTYILKERDLRGVVVALHILDPCKVKVLQAPNGDVYYKLTYDVLAGIPENFEAIPASEIIHDTMVALYHPLCGVSPITACYASAVQGMNIQGNSIRFFSNSSRPSGVLSADGHIGDDTAARLKSYWEEEFTGENIGRVAVLGDGLKFEPMMINAVDSELIKQLELSAKTVCSVFHVPPYKIGLDAAPSYNNIAALNQQYYDQCLQSHIESIELCLDEGLGLVDVQDHVYGTEFDLEGLIRMDPAAQMEYLTKAVSGAIFTPNEGRQKLDKPGLKGGDTVYMQQQNYSLSALDERDKTNPLTVKPQPTLPAPAPALAPAPEPPKKLIDEIDLAATRQFSAWRAATEWDEAA